MNLSRMNTKGLKLPCRDIVISHQPSGTIAKWAFKRKLKAVFEEANSDILSDDKLTQFQGQYGHSLKSISHEDFVILTSDMVTEFRRAIGAESYWNISQLKCKVDQLN